MVRDLCFERVSQTMSEERRIAERRRRARRRPDQGIAPEPPPGQALVPVAGAQKEPVEPTQAPGADAGFAAQILGQGGQKRGLRGGPETLDKARSTYLGAEWSGPADRRPRPGRITKTEI
jgi:hypothetical protein